MLVDEEDEGPGFAWTAEEFEEQSTRFRRMFIEVRAWQYEQEDRAAGRPVRSYAQAEVDELEEILAGRRLRERAAAGDEQALRELVEEAARYELMIEEIERENEATIARLEAGH